MWCRSERGSGCCFLKYMMMRGEFCDTRAERSGISSQWIKWVWNVFEGNFSSWVIGLICSHCPGCTLIWQGLWEDSNFDGFLLHSPLLNQRRAGSSFAQAWWGGVNETKFAKHLISQVYKDVMVCWWWYQTRLEISLKFTGKGWYFVRFLGNFLQVSA